MSKKILIKNSTLKIKKYLVKKMLRKKLKKIGIKILIQKKGGSNLSNNTKKNVE